MRLNFLSLAVLSLIACVVFSVVGLASMPWPDALPWHGAGAIFRYIGYLACVTGLVVFFSRLVSFSPIVVGIGICLVLATLLGEMWPLLVAAWFFLASYLLGRRFLIAFSTVTIEPHAVSSLLVGAGIYGSMVGLLAHFPLNYPGVYGVALMAPVLIDRRFTLNLVQNVLRDNQRKSDEAQARYWQQVLLVVVASVYFVVGLMPEVGYDPLAMHLFIPSQLASRQQWGFDASMYVWAVMPMLADWIFSIGYMLGGELASRLINVGFVFVLSSLVRDLALWMGGSANAGRLAAILLLSTPLTFTEGSTLHVDGVWSAFLVCATFAVLRLITLGKEKGQNLIIIGVLLGCALAAKVITLMMLPLLSGVMLFKWRLWVNRDLQRPIVIGIAGLVIIGIAPYIDAWRLTGNPVFPFFNTIFQSPLYPLENFKDLRWAQGLSMDTLYAITFHSGRYQEAMPGTPGFQWMFLLVPSIILTVGVRNYKGLALFLLGVLFVVFVFSSTSYLRYVFPAIVLLCAPIAVSAEAAINDCSRLCKFLLVGLLLFLILLNLLFLNSASWYGDFQLQSLLSMSHRNEYLVKRLPVRKAVEVVNELNVTGNPVLFISEPFGARLNADAVYANWYNLKFRNSLSIVNSDVDALNLLRDSTIAYVVADKNWRGDGDKFGKMSSHIQNVTIPIAEFGSVSVRKINSDLLFKNEVLINPDFSSKDGWLFAQGAEFAINPNHVVVSEPAPVWQPVAVGQGREYLNVVEARCVDKEARGRLQINWHNAESKFIRADIVTFECDPDWTEHSMRVRAPSGSTMGLVYTSGQAKERVAYRRNSLLQ